MSLSQSASARQGKRLLIRRDEAAEPQSASEVDARSGEAWSRSVSFVALTRLNSRERRVLERHRGGASHSPSPRPPEIDSARDNTAHVIIYSDGVIVVRQRLRRPASLFFNLNKQQQELRGGK